MTGLKHEPRTPIIGIAGWKKSGKTTLTECLVHEFTDRGLKVAAVKHAHHAFQIDDGATDSARHRRAGADQVAIVSAKRWALVTELDGADEPDFEDVIAALDPCDLIVVEGYKSAAIPKIEARRRTTVTRTPLSDDDRNVIAIAADYEISDAALPTFSLKDIAGIADFIDRTVGPLAARFGKTAGCADDTPAMSSPAKSHKHSKDETTNE